MIQKQSKSRGFTIVELLIVIIVIAILAAITIVAYNGVQNRARTSSAQAASNMLQKKIEAFNAATGAYPVTGSSLVTQMATVNESSLTGAGVTILAAAPTSGNGVNSIQVQFCTVPAAATGYNIIYFNFTTSLTVTVNGGTNGTACTTYTNVTP
jgi:prepilin-type N-terminal cleavage/methylation domain-containing protein